MAEKNENAAFVYARAELAETAGSSLPPQKLPCRGCAHGVWTWNEYSDFEREEFARQGLGDRGSAGGWACFSLITRKDTFDEFGPEAERVRRWVYACSAFEPLEAAGEEEG